MNIGLNAAVYCAHDYCGVTHQLIIQPQGHYLTHLVVKPGNFPAVDNRVERLIPIALVTEVSDTGIWLKCSLNDFANLVPFTEMNFTEVPAPDYGLLECGFLYPLVSNQTWMQVPFTKYNIPPGETVIGHQTQIEAQNGHLGQFKAFIVRQETGEISHLVFQRGHLWDRKSEIVAVSVIDRLEGETIYLNINKSDLPNTEQ